MGFLDWLTRRRPAPVSPWPEGDQAQRLRAGYLEQINEEPKSLDERVAYHLYHLSLYWSRWTGFLQIMESEYPGQEPDVAGGPMVMVQVGTELSGEDVRAYCEAEADPELRDAWTAYEAELAKITEGMTGFAAAIRAGNARFSVVDDLRTKRRLLHPFELEKPYWMRHPAE